MQSTPFTHAVMRRRHDLDGVTLAETVYEPHRRIATHSHNLAVLVLVLDGSMTTMSRAGSLAGASNSVRLVMPGETHSNVYGPDGARCFLVVARPELRQQVGKHATLLERALPDGARPGVATILRRMHQELLSGDDVAPLAMQGCVLDLLALLRRAESRAGQSPRWLVRVHELLAERFRDGVTIRDLSAEAGVHPVHLARQFRAHYGCSPSDYVRSLRVERARNALRVSDAPVSVVAAECGFADQSHLTREFRRVVGTTPARYRAMTRN